MEEQVQGPSRVSVLFQALRDKIASGRHAVSVYEMSPLPPLPPDIVVAESAASEPQKSVVDESATAHYHSDITANDPGHRSTGHQSTATDAGTNWSHNSTTAYTSSSEEAYAQDPTLFNRVWRAIRKGSAKYVVYIIPLFVLTIGGIVMIAYLVWGNKQGPLGNEGTGGLYLNAFGDCTPLNGTLASGVCKVNGTTEYYASLNRHQFGSSMEVSPVCGKCMVIRGPRGKVQAMIVGVCTHCAYGGVQLSQAAFLSIADANSTRVPVAWGPC